jgi:glycosyltransferase involved in cell wall biosynthesis
MYEYEINIPDNCNYERGNKMYIPVITKLKNIEEIFLKKLINPTICFATMCKNESHCILETLESCYKYCHYWIVCDTGSTDNTCELIIKFFKEKNIPGELFRDEWVGFGYNKTRMFERCYKKTDYIIHPDADDIIIGTFDFTYEDSGKLAYNVKIKRGNTFCSNLFVWNNNYRWKICGNAHTIARCLDKNELEYGELIHKDFYLLSRDTGSRSTDCDKYYKDALILQKQFVDTSLFDEDNLNSRSVFYTAQSFYDFRVYKESLKWYIIYTKLKDIWDEELFECYLRISDCMTVLEYEEQQIVGYLNKAITLFRERAEPFFKLGQYYYDRNKYYMAYLNFKIAKNKVLINVLNKYKLFINTNHYELNVNYKLACCCLKMCKETKSPSDIKYYKLEGQTLIQELYSKGMLNTDINNINMEFGLVKG